MGSSQVKINFLKSAAGKNDIRPSCTIALQYRAGTSE